MKPGRPKLENHFFLPQDAHLFDYDQIFSVSAMWVELGMDKVVGTYDLFIRDWPPHRNFLIFGGLEEIIEGIKNWRFSRSEVNFLKKNNVVTPKMAKLLMRFRYSGDVLAMPEGTVFFPGEPVVRLTGPIWEINLLTFFLINALTSNTIFTSKIVRSYLAAEGSKTRVVTCPVTRAHGFESSLKFGRAAYILGGASPLVPSFARKFNLPMSKVNTKAYHAFIKSFPTEIEAMRAAAGIFSHIGVMADTYDFKQGVRNAIKVAEELKPQGKSISFVVIDSGKNINEYISRARWARKMLDKAGFKNIGISAMGNFNEVKIAQVVRAKAPIDSIVPCTDLITSIDAPKLEAVLKLAEFVRDDKLFYSVKLTAGKESYPGKKQVFRTFDKSKMKKDVIGLEREKLGKPLLQPYILKGRPVKALPDIEELKAYTLGQIKALPSRLKSVQKDVKYPVAVSPKLMKLFTELKKKHLLSNSPENLK